MKKFLPVLLILLSLLSLNCGYTTSSALPGNFRTIYVADFKNKIDFTTERKRDIYFPLLEVSVRDAVVDRFMFDGNLRIAREGEADLVMTGELIDYNRGALRYTDDDEVEEYRIQIIVDIVLNDTAQDEVVWRQRIIGEATYFVTGALATTETGAVDDAKVDLARRVVERTIENW